MKYLPKSILGAVMSALYWNIFCWIPFVGSPRFGDRDVFYFLVTYTSTEHPAVFGSLGYRFFSPTPT